MTGEAISPSVSGKRKRISDLDHGKGEELQMYTVKRGLASFLCPLLDETAKSLLLDTVRDDVRVMSRLYIETTLFVNYYYTKELSRLDEHDFKVIYPVPRPQELMSLLRSNAHKRHDWIHEPTVREYFAAREHTNKYDGRLRNNFMSSFIKRYLTLLETNIKTHAFKRIKRYAQVVLLEGRNDYSKAQLHATCYAQYYDRQAGEVSEINAWFDKVEINAKALETRHGYWSHLPTFFHMRRAQVDAGGKGYNLFPILQHGLKHVDYDSLALWELTKRVWPGTVPSTWPKMTHELSKGLWNRYFDCPRRFRYFISTDGVAVSISMNRIVKKKPPLPSKKKKCIQTPKLQVPRDSAVAVDPGAREPLVTCRLNNGHFEYRRLSAKRVYFDNGEKWREKKRKKITDKVDQVLRENRERLEKTGSVVLSPKYSEHVHDYTRFKLDHFERLQQVYERRKLVRLRFEKYSRQQRQMERIVKEFFRPGETVLYGSGCTFMNTATVRGHRKFSHNKLIHCLVRNKIDVRVVNEAYTTKHCSNCKHIKNIDTPLTVSKSPHRYVYCQVCRKGMNRDKNGSKNILLKHSVDTIVVGPSFVGPAPAVDR